MLFGAEVYLAIRQGGRGQKRLMQVILGHDVQHIAR